MKKLKGAPQLGLSHFPYRFSIVKLTAGLGKEKNSLARTVKSAGARMVTGLQ